ncbi:anti-phage ZorAB system protein ZorA [Megasphaera elsdenii]|uniref:anti-phage ZorAB system protein ZorA n=1 Tax=Megasphaera elsdenii TaxID=907 RepID=UPI00242CDD9A|nr:anti-phage ZorAB system protein ZorA [Megasphaera elsdenii]
MSNTVLGIIIFLFSVGVAGIVSLFFYKNCGKLIRLRNADIRKLNQQIKNYDSSMNFFQELDEKMKENHFIFPLWEKYRRNFIIIPDDEEINHVYSTTDADEYFNFSNLSAGISIEFWQNLAGVFTGLGILGTFLGLTIGLLGFDMSSSATIQKGISNLLNGTSTAFLTSIVGILCALIFNYYYNNSLIRNFDASIDDFANKLDELIPRKQAEELLYINSEAVKEQTTELQDFNTTLALTIGDALRNAMTTDVKPVLEELLTAIRELSTGGMETIKNSINDNTGSELRDFAGTLQELQQGMRDILMQSQQMNEENNQKLRVAVDEMVKSLQNATSDSVTAQQKNMNEMNEQIKGLFTEMNDNLRQTVQGLLEAGSNTGIQLDHSIKGAAETSDAIVKTWESVSKQQQEQLSHNIEQIRNILEETLRSIRDDRENYIQTLKNITQELQNTMASSDVLIKQAGVTANQFASAAGPMNDVAHTMNTSVNNVIDATKSFNNQVGMTVLELKDTSSSNIKSVNTIREALERTEESWHAYENVFQGLDAQLGKTFTELEENLVKYNQLTQSGLSDNLIAFDKNIGTAIGQVNALVQELQEAIEDLTDQKSINQKNRTFNRGR